MFSVTSILCQKSIMRSTFSTYLPFLFVCHSPRLPLCVPLLSISRSVCLSAEMSPSFVTRLGSDWTVHPFSVWLTRLSRWRHPFIPAVQQSAPHCNPSLHPKHRCEGPGYFSGVHVHTVLVYTQTKKCILSIHNCCVCTHFNLWANTHCADISYLLLWPISTRPVFD